MSFIGIKFLLAKSVQARPVHLGAVADRIEARLEERLHPHSAFMTGLVRVMGNVGVLVFWVFLAPYFISHGWVTPDWPGKLACVAGVAVGTGGWFTRAELGGVTRPRQIQREDAAADGTLLRRLSADPGAGSGRNHPLADAQHH